MSFPQMLQGSGGPPSQDRLLAWYIAHPSYVTLDGTNVTGLIDRTGNGNDLELSDPDFPPTYEATGWNGGPDVYFNDNDDHTMELVGGRLLTELEGNAAPFTVFATLQVTSLGDSISETFFRWHDAGGNSRIECNTDSSGVAQLSFLRRDSGGTSVAVGGGIALRTRQCRVAWIFSGSELLSTYVDDATDLSAEDLTAVGSMTLTRFQMGANGFLFRLKEALFYSAALNDHAWRQYLTYSRREFGLVAPEFVSAGTAAYTNAIGGPSALTPAYPGGLVGGETIACHALAYLDDVSAPPGWTLRLGPGTTSNQNSYWFVRDAPATGSETGTVTFPITGTDRTAARMYAFRNVSGIESADTTFGNGAIPNPTVNPQGRARLGILAWAGFTTAGTIVPGGSPTGGTWTEAAEYVAPSIFFLELQTGNMAAGNRISGGTTTIGGTNQAFCHAFALIGN